MSTTFLYVSGRRTGKTIGLIRLAHDEDATLLVNNERQLIMAKKICTELGFDNVSVMTYWRYLNGGGMGLRSNGIVLDNIELFLESQFDRSRIIAASMSDNGPSGWRVKTIKKEA